MFRYRLIILLVVASIAAICFAWLPPTAISVELRRDLKIPSRCSLWVLENDESVRALGVFHDDDSYILFAAHKGWYSSGDSWTIPVVVASGASEDQPEDVIEDRLALDHFPTKLEIQRFRDTCLAGFD
ncbi:hypothetical protein CEE69_20950 [Rhodopirellula bahusiensis]|uniref:Uncharacterized protein n=1 Tax=Rhodopirellula bahusiensis TaxID=2014065 RepID=A0A2G1W2G2_9BACT|nr:hypothetical protein CEE69_20950 [Rhodopirellula bahusiensis]